MSPCPPLPFRDLHPDPNAWAASRRQSGGRASGRVAAAGALRFQVSGVADCSAGGTHATVNRSRNRTRWPTLPPRAELWATRCVPVRGRRGRPAGHRYTRRRSRRPPRPGFVSCPASPSLRHPHNHARPGQVQRRRVDGDRMCPAGTGLREGCSWPGPGCDQRTSYRATMLHGLAALDVVARANERTYHEPAVANFQLNLARPAASADTLTRL